MKILFGNFDPNVDYNKLVVNYDKAIISVFKENTKSKYFNKLKQLEDSKNIKLIKKSIREIVSKYTSDFKIKHNLYTLLTLQEIYSYISNKSEYKIYAHRTEENDINLVATLDSSKLKNLLNTKL